MRRLTLRRRRRRNRAARAANEVAVRIGAVLWVARLLVRGARSAGR